MCALIGDDAPGSLTILHAGLGHLVDLVPARPHGSPGAALNRTGTCVVGSAPGCRVVALEGGRGDAPAQPGLAAAVLVVGHLGDLPARRGHNLQIAKIYRAIKQAVGLAIDPL
jgi:hypothetical protein